MQDCSCLPPFVLDLLHKAVPSVERTSNMPSDSEVLSELREGQNWKNFELTKSETGCVPLQWENENKFKESSEDLW